jgi:hypothetical protein
MDLPRWWIYFLPFNYTAGSVVDWFIGTKTEPTFRFGYNPLSSHGRVFCPKSVTQPSTTKKEGEND